MIGIDTHLRLKTLLNKIDGDYGMSELKHLLCPLFARSQKEQAQFAEAFDTYFGQWEREMAQLAKATIAQAPETVSKETAAEVVLPKPPKKWQYITWFLILLLSLSAFFLYRTNKNIAQQIADQRMRQVMYEDSVKTAQRIEPQQVADTNGIPPPPTEMPTPTAKAKTPEIITLPLRGTIIDENIADLQATLWQQYGNMLWWILILGVPLGYAISELYRKNRKHAYLQAEKTKGTPDYWNPIKVDHSKYRLFRSASFYEATKHLRTRQEADTLQLDIDNTIRATLEAGGYPIFEYRQTTKPPEYLVLIDEASNKDHLASFYDKMIGEMAQQDLFVVRYFFRDDPRLCWQKAYKTDTQIEDLYRRYPSHRLLIISDADFFLHPIHEQPKHWLPQLEKWEERALLSTKPTNQWGYTESQLAKHFDLIPATTQCLAALPDLFNRDEATSLRKWLTANELPKVPDTEYFDHPTNKTTDTTALKNYLNDDAFQLLCACCVYPELHWDFTLHLAQQLYDNSLPPKDLDRLCRLQWFREGYIPDEDRTELLRHITPQTAQIARQAVVAMLLQNPPPSKSYAWNEYQMNLVLQKWHLAKNKKEKQHLEGQLDKLFQNAHNQHFATVKYSNTLNKMAPAIKLPTALNKILFKDGLSVFGIKPLARGIGIAFIVLFLAFFFNPPSSKKLKQHQGQFYFIKKEQDAARFYTAVANDFFKNESEDLGKAIAAYDQSLEHLKNIKAYYNQGIAFYELAARKDTFELDDAIFFKQAIANWNRAKSGADSISLARITQTEGSENDSLTLLTAIEKNTYYHLAAAQYMSRNYATAYGLFNAEINAYRNEKTQTESEIQNLADNYYGKALSIIFGRDSLRMAAQRDNVDYSADVRESQRIVKGLPFSAYPSFVNALDVLEQLLTIKADYLSKESQLVTLLITYYLDYELRGYRSQISRILDLLKIDKADLNTQVKINEYIAEAGYQLEDKIYDKAETTYKKALSLDSLNETALQGLATVAQSRTITFLNSYKGKYNTQTRQSNTKDVFRNFHPLLIKGDSTLSISLNGKAIKNAQLSGDNTRHFKIRWTKQGGNGANANMTFSKKPVMGNDPKVEYIKSFESVFEGSYNDILEFKGQIGALPTIEQTNLPPPQEVQQKTIEPLVNKKPSPPAKETKPTDYILPKMVYVKGGTFLMGSNEGNPDEKPVHSVQLDSYSIGKYEVTNEEFCAFLNDQNNPVSSLMKWGKETDKNIFMDRGGKYQAIKVEHPVTSVTWQGANAYCVWLSEKTGKNYRLPTEAEWEFAAKGGLTSTYIEDYFTYSGSNTIDEVAWYRDNSGRNTYPVGKKGLNQLGIYDMSGNVWEWCSDWYAADYYKQFVKGGAVNPENTRQSTYRVLRGGSFGSLAKDCRSANRTSTPSNYIGFRLVEGSSKRY